MRKTKDIKIDDNLYTMGHWPVDKSTEMWAWIIETFGPLVKEAFAKLSSDDDIAGADIKDLEVGVELLDVVSKNLFSSMKPKEYSARIKSILTGDILCNGKEFDYNYHFSGNLYHMHKVAFEVLKYQYADFLEGVRSLSAKH